ncbi:30S ribosomal protein S17 [Leptospira borgpetersenii]|uniref:Small ribosomal subunit protein uS17 n=2 Tax=Leptospira borgpetersenii TaxID=174 RepID=A0A0E3B5K2_LEPBO|nr:30S ribosomal protein S17 [Leptospira borgpetersenii]ALO27733.1 30S ribosomal protein S17 [Leptospira borgpetersenii serovar Ballum]ANH01981.1 30S ribosomal protein S17 [Leptospira borgpetersenii str. 4E]KGE25822.1 30S ribosomal protein S17 [Leptospira borgpetersenii serovar Ballum]MBE8161763.1 30S ribosomal protein S17 [Leptospira borgpetersenii serovar Ballum]MBE8166205.1 30S ribosomal protein S17 [Leptospira borgpetersenii serovar Ballum]
MTVGKQHINKLLLYEGRVVSNSMNKTVVIVVETRKTHPKFKKIVRRSVKIKVHDEKNECTIGDKILAIETRPLSREKRHRLYRIVEKAK